MSTGNQGIQGTSVNIAADALAVGSHARATSRRVSAETTHAALHAVVDFKRALAALGSAASTQEVSASVEHLAATVTDPKVQPHGVAGAVQRVIGALEKAGTVVEKVESIAAPLARLAGLFGVPVPWAG